MRLIIFILFFFFSNGLVVKAVQDSVIVEKDTVITKVSTYIKIDSATLARKAFVKDSITWYYLNPDPARPNLFVEKILRDVIVLDPYLLSPPKTIKKLKNIYGIGQHINHSPLWFLPTILVLITLFAIVNIVFKKELILIFKAFIDNRTLNQLNKEEGTLISWQYLFLYIIFSLTFGLFICLLMYKTKASATATDFTSFLVMSLSVFVFLTFKILILKFIGFLFLIQKVVTDYLNIIYLTFFNSLFLLLPITFCLSLASINLGFIIIWVFFVAFFAIIVYQFVRIAINILLNYRLSKFYLILYLCILEICPILLFAKAINISL